MRQTHPALLVADEIGVGYPSPFPASRLDVEVDVALVRVWPVVGRVAAESVVVGDSSLGPTPGREDHTVVHGVDLRPCREVIARRGDSPVDGVAVAMLSPCVAGVHGPLPEHSLRRVGRRWSRLNRL